jgi:hypothetical protein
VDLEAAVGAAMLEGAWPSARAGVRRSRPGGAAAPPPPTTTTLQLAAAQQQASVGTSAILEASTLREEVKRERSRADVAMQQAEQAMRGASIARGSEGQLLEAMARLAQRDKDVEMLQATVRKDTQWGGVYDVSRGL